MPIYKKIIVSLLLALSLFAKEGSEQKNAKVDALIINGFYAKESGDVSGALEFFREAYALAPSSVLAYESAAMLIRQKKFYEAIEELQDSLKKFGSTEESDRLLISAYLHLNDTQAALGISQDLLKKSRSQQNLQLAASVLFANKDYLGAEKLFNEAYMIDNEESILLKLADTNFYFLGNKTVGKDLLKKRIEEFGCSYEVCKKLLSYEQEEKNFSAMPSIYMSLYETYKQDSFAIAAAETYIMNKQNEKAIDILTKSGVDNSLLLDVYKFEKRYKEALEIANEIYRVDKTPQNLAQVAFLEYEGSDDKNSTKLLKSICEKLEEITKNIDDDVIDNFYGYLLIDHDIDVQKGLLFVRRALEKQPDSPYYLDSLAWGYYKLGECKDALEPMEKAYEKLKNEEEIEMHLQKIKKCIKEKR